MNVVKCFLMIETLGLFKGISLPVEGSLWGQISRKPEVKRLLDENTDVLLIGTDPFLTLARAILDGGFDGNITVIESDSKIAWKAQKMARDNKWPVRLISKDVFEVTPEEIDSSDYRLAIAKHLIHFVDGPELVLQVRELMNKGGFLYASTPAFKLPILPAFRLGKKTESQLAAASGELGEKFGISLKKEPFVDSNGREIGDLFCFSYPG